MLIVPFWPPETLLLPDVEKRESDVVVGAAVGAVRARRWLRPAPAAVARSSRGSLQRVQVRARF